ncbi:outer membrane autotransporter protein [Labrenzia sp. MBR-25]
MKTISAHCILPRLSARLRLSTALCAATLIVALPHVASAATFTVTEATDDGSGTVAGSLSWAIASAGASGDVIEIDPAVSTITVSGTLPAFVQDVTVRASAPVEITGSPFAASGTSLVLSGESSTNALTTALSGTLAGETGANGVSGSGGTNGTAGEAGAIALSGSGFSLTLSGSTTGGNGGAGGSGGPEHNPPGNGGGGGNGAAAFSGSDFKLENQGTITGGSGGNGGRGGHATTVDGGRGGNGGAGGAGIAGTGLVIENSGTITGGEGGHRGGGGGSAFGITGPAGSEGVGAAGITGSDLTIVNKGTISGGLSGGGVRANAIEFTSGTNSLELWNGSTITGNVVAGGSADTLILGGGAGATFDLTDLGSQYTGFEALSKSGTSTWVLHGTSGTAVSKMDVDSGTLVMDGAELDGTALTVGSGTLNLASGSTLTSASADISGTGGLEGFVTLVDTGTTWNNGATLSVGTTGDGRLQIANAAKATSGETYIGRGSKGTLAIYGPVSSHTTTGDFHAGFNAGSTGTVFVSTGGMLKTQDAYLGYKGGSSGSVTITHGSTWDGAGGAIWVGVNGEGSLLVADGGQVNTALFSSSSQATGVSTVKVTGAGSHLRASTSFRFGSRGKATLTVADGGAVTIGSGVGTMFLSDLATGKTTLNIGAAAGDTAVAPGTINAASVTSGDGTATIVFNHTDGAYSFAPNLSGNASLEVYAGTTTLAGNNSSFSGTTTINGGTLKSGSANGFAPNTAYTVNGGVLDLSGFDLVMSSLKGSGGEVALGAVDLTVNSSGDSTFAGVLSGSGDVIKQGAARLTLTGDSSGFSGTTKVSAGRLTVNGSLGGMIEVTGGSIGGSGTLSALGLGSGGTVSPGNSIGTLTVSGNVSFAAGSIYDVEVDSAGNSDKIAAGGTATIAGGTVRVDPESGSGDSFTYNPLTSYTILTAKGGVSGTFDSVTDSFAFLNSELSYGATSVTLDLIRNDTSFADVARTTNQRAVAGSLSGLASTSDLYRAVAGLNETQARRAYDSLSGEIHASLPSMFLNDSARLRDTVTSRIHDAFAGFSEVPEIAFNGPVGPRGPGLGTGSGFNLSSWGSAYGAYGKLDGDGNAATLSRSTGGALVGLEATAWPQARFGLLAGLGQSQASVSARTSSADANSYTLGAYGGVRLSDLGLTFGAAYSWHDVSSERAVAAGGLKDTLTADYWSRTAQVFGEASYALETPWLQVSPFAGLALLHQQTDAFQEQGSAALALTGDGSSQLLGSSTLGLRISKTLTTTDGISAALTGALGWRHAIGDLTPDQRMALSGLDPFTVQGVPLDRDTALVEAGLALTITDRTTLGLSYQGAFGENARDQGANARVNISF